VKDSVALRTIAFLVIIWSVLVLAVSLPHLDMGPEEKIPQLPGPKQANTTAGSGGSGEIARILYIVFIGSLIAMSALYIVISALKKDKEAFKEILAGLLVLIVVSGFFMGALYIMDHPNILGVHMNDASSGNGTGNSTVVEKYEAAGAVQYMAALFAGAIVVIALVSLAISMRSRKIEKVESQSEELRKKMNLAINDLKKGKEVQEVIIKCYDDMCRILTKSSGMKMKEEDAMTPREFEMAILQRMEIDKGPVERLTALFEEAKYSKHPIDNSKRKDAIKALQDLKDEVERWEREKE
jgi:hypothetical protein